jgi:DNA-binding CsgD family transcriptional regulator
MDWDLTDRQREVLRHYTDGKTTPEIAEVLGVAPTTIETHRRAIQDAGVPLAFDRETNTWYVDGSEDGLNQQDGDDGGDVLVNGGAPDIDLDAVDVDPDAEPSPEELTDRERVVVSELETGATVDEIADRLDERESIVTEHIRDLKRSGWHVYVDETAEMVAIESDRPLRSSEHKGTRTRKANKWWELRHNSLVRDFRGLSTPEATLHETSGEEDWVTHLTDLHAGDRVRNDDGEVVYSTDAIPDVVDYITSQSLALAEKHGSTYDAAHLLWGGDMVTNEGIYEGQYEDLDAWLDEQHESLIDPLVRQIKAFSERFPTVRVVCQVGNHGQHRASGTSSQANADLILYKSIRNVIAQLQDHAGILDNVSFDIGEARAYKNFEMRDGAIRGHLRHGQHRRPQAETSARDKEWTKTLLDHEFDVAYMGHYHVSGRIPWDGPPILASPSPKPAGEFVENIGGRVPGGAQGVATAHGVSDDGLTGVFPIDMRKYDA